MQKYAVYEVETMLQIWIWWRSGFRF